jgi:hypothetical protein
MFLHKSEEFLEKILGKKVLKLLYKPYKSTTIILEKIG